MNHTFCLSCEGEGSLAFTPYSDCFCFTPSTNHPASNRVCQFTEVFIYQVFSILQLPFFSFHCEHQVKSNTLYLLCNQLLYITHRMELQSTPFLNKPTTTPFLIVGHHSHCLPSLLPHLLIEPCLFHDANNQNQPSSVSTMEFCCLPRPSS